MVTKGWMSDKTGEFIVTNSKNSNPGVYHEFPKTHKIKNEESPDFNQGFPSRGIVSCKYMPTEGSQDYSEMKVSPGMKSLKSLRRDTKHVFQEIEKTNNDGEISDKINLAVADIDNMYGNMPLELSERGVRENLNLKQNESMPTKEILNGLEICQERNVFEFKGQLYRQKKGHATGQKQAPPVACQGAGIVEREFLNTPRDIVFDESKRCFPNQLMFLCFGVSKIWPRTGPDSLVTSWSYAEGI